MSVELKKSAFEASLAKGNTVKEMAKELGVSVQTIRDAAKHWNISLRSKPIKSKQVKFVDDMVEQTQQQEGVFNTSPTTVTLGE